MGASSKRASGEEHPQEEKAFGRIQSLLRDPVGSLKKVDKPILGWLCCYTPLEIILAAGVNPYRVIPEPTSDMADSFLHSNFCPFVRSSLAKALKGELDFLDGCVLVNSCDGLRRLYDAWRLYAKTPRIYFIDLPRISTETAVRRFRETLIGFKGSLEQWIGCPISGGQINDAIVQSDRGRRLLKELYVLRKNHTLPLSGSQVFDVVRGEMVLPKEEYLGLLERLVDEIKQGVSISNMKDLPRVMITGSLLEDSRIADLVEESGGKVVCDDLCTGSRYFWDSVQPFEEPLLSLSRYYLSKIPCARMMDFTRRIDHVMDLVAEFEIHGVICYTLKFCDTFLYDVPLLKKRLDARKIPSLFLDSDYTPGSMGRIKTRIEAFLELLREHV